MILIIDSFFTGSHKYWGQKLQENLPYDVKLLTLSGKYWKWRMEGGAYELAQKFKTLNEKPKVIIATDMVNIPLFYAFSELTKEETPCILYFHENQFAYPISDLDTDKKQGRDNHYSFINLTSALFANHLVFNSEFNQLSFTKGAQTLINNLPENKFSLSNINSSVIYPGIEKPLDTNEIKENSAPVILWNHRWEHDKNPDLFLKGLNHLKSKNIKFKLIILGKGTEKQDIKSFFENNFKSELIHCGYAENRTEYSNLLSQATHLPVTSKHDFFGLSVAEGMSHGCFAILPNHQAYPEHLKENPNSGVLYDFPNGYFEALEKGISCKDSANVNQLFHFDEVTAEWIKLLNIMNLDVPRDTGSSSA